jgi:hypothetical protein
LRAFEGNALRNAEQLTMLLNESPRLRPIGAQLSEVHRADVIDTSGNVKIAGPAYAPAFELLDEELSLTIQIGQVKPVCG